MSAFELQHVKTGSDHLHLARDDKNNVFSVSLRTTPMNSTGVAHVLEHVALCGSHKFPVRDPFFKMLDRSMATFMNAMTGADYTVYPFSTQNEKDFQNLLSVYLDAVFYPRLQKLDFLQEGWRLEHEINTDPDSPIVFKGVVFNEMKGVMADPSYLYGTSMQSKLLPDHTYGVCSGGNPANIPQLTWEELKDFHAGHYHPSNARFITYGDLPLENHLKFINEKVMINFDKIDPGTEVPLQSRWNNSRSATIQCAPDDMAANQEKQTTYSKSFILPEVSDIFESFTAAMICNLLIDGPASPFYKTLIESGMGSDYSPMTGYHSHQKEAVFSIGLQGINQDDASKLDQIIRDTFVETAKNGFSSERIDAMLHRLELQHKHQSSQFGLGLTFNLMPIWQHGTDPIQALKVDSIVKQFRQHLKTDDQFLQKKCTEYFLTNTHHLNLTMTPDPEYKASLEKREKAQLESMLDNLSHEDKTKVYEQAVFFWAKASQFVLHNLVVALNKGSINQMHQTSHKTIFCKYETPVITCVQPTNGVTYFNAVLPVNGLRGDLMPYLPLFCEVFTQMGTHTTDYVTFSQREDLVTGGLSASATSSCFYGDSMTSETSVRLSSHCLDRNVSSMFDLWGELFREVNMNDTTRLQTLIRQRAQELANSVSFSGHLFAMKSAARPLAPSAGYSEQFGGLTQVNFMKQIADSDDIDDIIMKLNEIALYVLRNNKDAVSRFALHATPHAMSEATTSLTKFVENIQLSDVVGKSKAVNHLSKYIGPIYRVFFKYLFSINLLFSIPNRTFHDLPLPVNFTSMCIATNTPYSHADNPALRLLARLITTKFLHKQIREKGGAYGGGAKHGDDGIFRFYSYRDPNNWKTIQAFKDGVKWALNGDFDQENIDEAKLAIFQSIDSPVSPCNRGLNIFNSGLYDVTIQQHRDRLLDVAKDELVDVAMKYLKEPKASSVVIIGPQEKSMRNTS
uniref:Presequence protease, mitochondrial n=1 Tax=Ciona savignyi TaxID=51511 RepID=H2Z9X9_CIOSA